MKLIEKYKSGKTIEVYQDIDKLGAKAFEEPYLSEITELLTETFERVKYNLGVIHVALINIGYHFKTECKYHSEKPLTSH